MEGPCYVGAFLFFQLCLSFNILMVVILLLPRLLSMVATFEESCLSLCNCLNETLSARNQAFIFRLTNICIKSTPPRSEKGQQKSA